MRLTPIHAVRENLERIYYRCTTCGLEWFSEKGARSLTLVSGETDSFGAGKPSVITKRVLRVLVIDDNADHADALVALLRSCGHAARCAADGESGLELSRAFNPDIVFCDIGLPRMDGFEFCEALRRHPQLKHTPVFALTGRDLPHLRTVGAKAGFDGYFAKPLEQQTLQSLLRICLVRGQGA